MEEEEVPKYLEKEELALLLETAKSNGLEHDYLVFLVLAYTGIRVGELVGLKWKDIDFKNHTISITKTYYNPNNNAMEFQLLSWVIVIITRTLSLRRWSDTLVIPLCTKTFETE